jgi:hypothetical protein
MRSRRPVGSGFSTTTRSSPSDADADADATAGRATRRVPTAANLNDFESLPTFGILFPGAI